MTRLIRSTIAAALLIPAGPFAQALSAQVPSAQTPSAQVLGSDAAACQPGAGPAIEATITGLKDGKGDVRLELYPATAEDFLKGDHELIAQDKVFRRVSVAAPATGRAGAVAVCIRVPRPGRYALMMIHSRDGRNKFDYKIDGAGTPSNKRIGFGKPKVEEASIAAGAGVTPVAIRAQYMGLFGFSPH
ncbi:DUF2141 domain-containing protein [Sphingomonas bacterium]|uniref:DUF2141 domain-containing protein n=1 Tax=Sphingomonas bacterium TaxID=1895847 RepID=UPI001576736E|nr:DUF2141 domain-containing protein [Sphingomonas bacterium]